MRVKFLRIKACVSVTLIKYSVNGSEKSIWEETLTVFADVIEMGNQLDEIVSI